MVLLPVPKQPKTDIPPPPGTELDSGWQNALVAFIAEGIGPGATIPHAWFREKFRLPDPMTCETPAEADKVRFAYLSDMQRFQEALALDHDLVLKSLPRNGYLVVPPDQQTAFAMDEVKREVGKAMGRAHMRLTHIRLDELTDDQRRENADAQGRLAALRQMVRRKQLE